MNNLFSVYAGIGYGWRSLMWNDMDGAWAEVSDWSHEGIAAETGLMFTLNRLVFSAGISSISFRTASVQLGFGITF